MPTAPLPECCERPATRGSRWGAFRGFESVAVDELATALEDFEALSADPSLLLGDNEKEKVEDIVDRATVVLESMNRDKWAEGGAVMTVAVVHVNWSRAEIVGALAALRRGVEPEGTERVRVSGRDATLVVWSPD
jgi:hypothetical protein